jgi:hypothetical protein
VERAAVSRRRFLAAGAALGAVDVYGLATADDAAAAPPPTEYQVSAFGAQGDGVTDDTTRIQTAIDTARTRGGGTVVFHAGTFLVSRPLVLYSKITLRGAGVRTSVIRKRGSGSFAILTSSDFASLTGTGSNGGAQNFSIQNLGFDGNADGGIGGHGIQTYGYGQTMVNVTVFNCAGVGIWSEFNGDLPPSDAIEAMVVNVKVHNCRGGGIYWHGPHDSQWANILVHSCGPPNVTTGSPTHAVEATPEAAGLHVTNGHVWGLNHGVGWYLNTIGAGLVNCTGEGASSAQVVLVGNDCQVVGGKYFAARDDRQTVGIEIGSPSAPPTGGSFVSTKVINCDLGSLKFTNDLGVGHYVLSAWQPTGNVVVGSPAPSNRLDLQVRGGASYGLPPTLQPSTSDAVRVRGDLQAGSASSLLGLFGADPQPRATGWAATGTGVDRTLTGASDLNELRNVLATLIQDLQKYGLLG